jgi:rhodanese-related sulfurtransferase
MRAARALVLEALLVAVLGLAFALAANALSPRGLRLARNYFPGAVSPAPLAGTTVNPAVTGTNLQPGQGTEAVLQRLRQRGLQATSSNEVVALFRDARYEQGLVVFVDARDDAHYQAGHIPGAWQFNHYRPENYLPAVLPACLNAQQVVVYCTGGACEDSEFAAVMLRDAGVPGGNLSVYTGGINEWLAAGLPVETGARGSGQMLPSKP